jgi:hypothetical protein
MAMRIWMAPVGLFLLQAAPVGLAQDQDGRYRLAFGAALGGYEERSVNCEGDVIARNKVKFHTVGGEAEVKLSPDVRLTAHAGTMSATPDPGTQLAFPYEGAYGGAMVAAEGARTGFGAGISFMPRGRTGDFESARRAWPMFHLRIGPIEKVHVLLETGGTAAPGLPPDLARVGLGGSFAGNARARYRFDLGVEEFPVLNEDGGGSGHFQVSLPVARSVNLGVVGSVYFRGSPGIGVFGSTSFGGPPRP